MLSQYPLLTENDLKSPAVILFAAVYLLALALALLSDPLQALIYLGMSLGTLLLIWLILDLTQKLSVADIQVKGQWLELVFGCLFFLVFQFTPDLYVDRQWALGEILKKELLYFVLPLTLLLWHGYPLSSVGFSFSHWKQDLKVAGIVLACMAIPSVFLISNTAKLILGGQISLFQALPALFLYFIHNIVRSGLPEEFFFRVFLQTRLSHIFKSRLGGLLIVSLLFGIVHIPSYSEMTLAEAFFKSIFLQGLMGVMFGVIWDRTRSLIPGVLVHSGLNALNNVGNAVAMLF